MKKLGAVLREEERQRKLRRLPRRAFWFDYGLCWSCRAQCISSGNQARPASEFLTQLLITRHPGMTEETLWSQESQVLCPNGLDTAVNRIMGSRQRQEPSRSITAPILLNQAGSYSPSGDGASWNSSERLVHDAREVHSWIPKVLRIRPACQISIYNSPIGTHGGICSAPPFPLSAPHRLPLARIHARSGTCLAIGDGCDD